MPRIGLGLGLRILYMDFGHIWSQKDQLFLLAPRTTCRFVKLAQGLRTGEHLQRDKTLAAQGFRAQSSVVA